MSPNDLTHLQREVYFELRRRNGAATNHQLAKVAGHRFGARVFELNDKGFDIINEPVNPDDVGGMKGVTLYAMLGVPRDWKKNSAVLPPADIVGESRVPELTGAGDAHQYDQSLEHSDPVPIKAPETGRSTARPHRTSTRPNGDVSTKTRKLPMPRKSKVFRMKGKHDWKDDPHPMWGGSERGQRCTRCGILVLKARDWLCGCTAGLTEKVS